VQGIGPGTSILLIAVGLVLAFVVQDSSSAISASAIGAMLIVVGVGGTLISLALLAGANLLAEDWQDTADAASDEDG
jgi:hypothetical protein